MTFEEAKERIALSRKIVGFTGAGISTESKIPDFRGPGGVWSKYRTVYFQDFVRSRDERVEYWRQKAEGWPAIRDAQPNEGHRAFAGLDKQGRLLAVITQNIDGLHQKAGLPWEKLIELHGNTTVAACLACGARIPMDEAIGRVEHGDFSPECRQCGGLLKPATVSFGQPMPEAEMAHAGHVCRECEVFVAVGSSLVVQPAATFPVLAKREGGLLVIVNRTDTPLDSEADLVVRGEIGEVLPELLGSNGGEAARGQ